MKGRNGSCRDLCSKLLPKSVTSPAPAIKSISDLRKCGESLRKRREGLRGRIYPTDPTPILWQHRTLPCFILQNPLHLPTANRGSSIPPKSQLSPAGLKSPFPVAWQGVRSGTRSAVCRPVWESGLLGKLGSLDFCEIFPGSQQGQLGSCSLKRRGSKGSSHLPPAGLPQKGAANEQEGCSGLSRAIFAPPGVSLSSSEVTLTA